MSREIEFAQYLNAKFCHELAGTLGAINNGVEFLEENNALMQKKAIELIKISAKQAISRLMFYRQAYGVAKSQGEADLSEFAKLTEGFLENTKITLDFNPKYMHVPNVFIDINTVKLFYCIIVIAASSLIHGGVIRLVIEHDNNINKIVFSALGENVKNDTEKSSILQGSNTDVSSVVMSTANIHTYYTRDLADKLNAKISIVQHSNNQIDYVLEIT